MDVRTLCGALALTCFSSTLLAQATPAAAPAAVPGAGSVASSKIQPALAAQLGTGDQELVRVIVSLDSRGRLPGQGQAAEIAAAQDRIIGVFAQSSSGARVLNRYQTLFGFSAELTRTEIQALAARSDVTYVERMPVHYKADAESFPLTDVDLAQGAGADGSGVVMAIIDDGIDYNLPDFDGKYLGGYDFGDNDPDPLNDCASQSHGTSVAGVALGAGVTAAGVAPGADFVFLKIQSSGLCGLPLLDGDLVGAIDWAVANRDVYGIDIISMSLGGGTYSSESACDASSSLYFNAIRNAVDAGITVIAASGNAGLCDAMARPACFSDVISVGAVYDAPLGTIQWCVSSDTCADAAVSPNCPTGYLAAVEAAQADNVIVYSNSASFLDLVAPSTCAATVLPGGTPQNCFGGTSSATPFAAGVAALAIESAGKGALTPEDIRALLTGTGDAVLDPKNARISPRVNGLTAVTQAPDYASGGGGEANAPPTAAFVSTCTDLACSFDAGGSADSDGFIQSYAWTFGDGAGGSGVSTDHSYATDGSYTVTLTVTDDDGASDTATATIDVSAAPGTSCSLVVDFEDGAAGWSNDTAASTCTTGAFVAARPTLVNNLGVITQVDGDHTTGSGDAYFTALNIAAGTNDVDGGNCVATSPVYDVAQDSTLSLWYFSGQRDAGDDPAGDFFRLELSTDGGSTWSTLAANADETVNAAWTQATAPVPAGARVQLRIQASDGTPAGDLVEAGIDDVSVCAAVP
ncbi:S8 family serine peptidase [uncultured Thiohalocapsa sp.]|uniref:S8 family serine peptidase n=1 Tax=uncultured Thiohalocapsa sp. TaxID=768990 RepID=UPI0025D74158|nr:S8 family serine peptidase [uncultured Thiohalocapsa sp.]